MCSLFGHFTQLVSDASGWAYGIVFLLALLDAIVPIVPSETAVITAGVVASAGDLSLAMIVPAAAAGAFVGDNSAYWIGRRFGTRVVERLFSGEKSRRRIEWAERQLTERGGELIAIARFIPGGRPSPSALDCSSFRRAASSSSMPWQPSAGRSTPRSSATSAGTRSSTRPGRASCSRSESHSRSPAESRSRGGR